MESTDKRSLTSPANGKKGGVKTVEGKAIASQNAIKHGILAKCTTSFDDVFFEDVYRSFAEEFGDETPTRKTLISQLSLLHIRLRRCARFEAEFMRAKLNPPKYERKLISKGVELDNMFADKWETTLVSPGEPMTLDPAELSDLENMYTKYETHFLSQFCRIVEYLTRSAN